MTQGANAATLDFRSIAAPCLGLAFIWPFFRSFYPSLCTTAASRGAEADAAQYCVLAMALLLGGLTTATGSKKLGAALSHPFAPRALCLLGAVGGLLQWVPAGGDAAFAASAVGAFLQALFFIGALVLYARKLSDMGIRAALLVCLVSFAACFTCNLVFFLPAAGRALFCALAPVATVTCLAKTNVPEKAGLQAGNPTVFMNTVDPRAFMVLMALFCVAGNVVRGISDPWFLYEGPSFRTPVMSLANIAVMTVSAALLLRGRRVEAILMLNWGFDVFLSFAGLLAIAVSGSGAGIPEVGSDLATVGRVGFTVLLLVFALLAAQGDEKREIRTIGQFLLIPEGVSAVARHIVIPACLDGAGAQDVHALVLVSVGAALILLGALTLFLATSVLGQIPAAAPEGKPDPGSDAPAGDDALERLARTFGLTARERETAALVSRGYSLEKTAELMGVSINTVRSHSRAVYGKLGIHARQDLIDMLDDLRQDCPK